MTVKYKSLSHLLRIVVRVNNKPVSIEFNKSNLGQGLIGSSFTTDNADIQKALESHEYFRRKSAPSFWTDDVKQEVHHEQETPKEVVKEESPVNESKKGRKPKTK